MSAMAKLLIDPFKPLFFLNPEMRKTVSHGQGVLTPAPRRAGHFFISPGELLQWVSDVHGDPRTSLEWGEVDRRAMTKLNARRGKGGRIGMPANPSRHGTAPFPGTGSGATPRWTTGRADADPHPLRRLRGQEGGDYQRGESIGDDGSVLPDLDRAPERRIA
jgi:hypothetical protein